jgi:nucleoside-diphosphate-sugar epimerase
MESCKRLIDNFKGEVAHYVFVASAGAYKANAIEPMHVEGDSRKATAGHVEVEDYLKAQGLPYTVFQPLYIYGPNTAKDCEQWFVDRIIRDRPVYIPAPGIQLTTLTHVEDVASMLALVPGNKKAIGQHYNICSDRCISFVGEHPSFERVMGLFLALLAHLNPSHAGIAKAVGKALGKEPNIVLYDPEKIGTGGKGKAEGFPFRTIHFFASSDKAKRELGWKPAHTFLGDVEDLVADYKKLGRDVRPRGEGARRGAALKARMGGDGEAEGAGKGSLWRFLTLPTGYVVCAAQRKEIDFAIDEKIRGLVGAK